MKKICLIGPVDKRAIAYPLIKCMTFLGKSLVITDDGVYRRFSETYESRFTYINADFIVTPTIDDDLLNSLEDLESQYEFVLYITTNELPKNCDRIIYARGVGRSICDEGVLTSLEEKEFTEVYVTFSKIGDSSALKIEPSKSTMAYIFECEEKKEFVETSDSSYSFMLQKLFESELGIPEKTVKGIMQRKG